MIARLPFALLLGAVPGIDPGGDWPVSLREHLANPNVVYLLLVLAFCGLAFEVAHPGAWVPGLFGLACLTLAVYAMQFLPINSAGLALLGLGLLLLLLELKVHSLGVLASAGIASLLLGAYTLIEPTRGVERVSWEVFLPASLGLAAILLLLVGNVLRAHARRVRTGKEGMVGALGVARTAVNGQGWVFVRGELWKARSEQLLESGDPVRVKACDGLTLEVEKAGEPSLHPGLLDKYQIDAEKKIVW